MAERNAAAVRTYVVEVETAALVCTFSCKCLSLFHMSTFHFRPPQALFFNPLDTNKVLLPRSAQQKTSYR